MKNIDSNSRAAAVALRLRSLVVCFAACTLVCLPPASLASKGLASPQGSTSSPRQVAHFRVDKTFNLTGFKIDRYLGANDSAVGASLQADGKVVIGVASSRPSLEVIRVNPDGTRDLTFGIDCKLETASGTIALGPDGKIYLSAFTPSTIVRCNSDGTLDGSFGSGGIVTITNPGFSIARLVVLPDGKIILGGGTTGNFTLARLNADGSRDMDFGTDGLAPAGVPNSSFNSITLQTDGKIVAAGSAGGDFAVVRFNPDGSLDSTFAEDGKVTTPIHSGNESANKVLMQPDGKILAAGFSLNSPLSTSGVFALVRYNPDGSLDTTFDGDGKVATPFTNNGTVMLAARIGSIELQPNGQILAAGQAHNGWNYDHALARYNADGSLDSGFGVGGFVVDPFPASVDHIDDIGSNLLVRPDGRVVSVGTTLNWHGGQDVAVWGFNPVGSVDSSVGVSGKAAFDVGGGRAYGTALAIQPDGKILAAGRSATGLSATGPEASHIARYNPDGSRDRTFGGLGFVTAPGQVNDIAIGSDGKILTVGVGGLYRFNSDGSLDTSFDGDGQVPGISSISRVLVQPDGKVLTLTSAQVSRRNVDGSLDSSFDNDGMAPLSFGSNLFELASDGKIVVGGSWNGNFAVVRLNADGSPDTGFDTDGLVTTDIAGSDQVTAIELQPDGKIIAAGWSTCCDFYQRKAAFVRYNTDGLLDASFGNGGKIELPNSNFGDVSNIYIRPDGKILTFSRGTSSHRFIRLTAGGQPDATFYGDGIAAFDNFRFAAPIPQSTHAEFDAQGRVVLMGTDRTQPSFNDNRSLWIGRMEMIDHPYVHFDFSGDGKADLAVYRPSSRTWHVMTPDRYTVTGHGQAGDKPVPGDYDGDGITDLAVFRPSNSSWHSISSESGGPLTWIGYGSNATPIPADRDGDGRDDFSFLYTFAGQLTTSSRYSESNTNNNFPLGVQGDKPIRGDFDGDGKADVALFRPSNRNWYIMSPAYTQGFYAVQWGEDGDIPVPADYDGDGATDIAVWRPSTGRWWIMGSSAGWMVGTVWGEPGDKPVPADYDGDGKTDIAVWRPSNGSWYIVQSADTSIRVEQFGEEGDIPLPNAFIY